MNLTLSDILSKVGGYVDQDTTLPSGTELTTRVNLVQRSTNEWANAYDWKVLRSTQKVLGTISMSSIGLPTNFRKMQSPVYDLAISLSGSSNDYFLIDPKDRFTKLSTDRYIIQEGNSDTGFYLTINPPLASLASLQFDIQSFPSSLATLNSKSVCPSPEYEATRTIAYILEQRSDPRFPQVKTDADKILLTMIEDEASPTKAELNRVPDQFEQAGFVIGEY